MTSYLEMLSHLGWQCKVTTLGDNSPTCYFCIQQNPGAGIADASQLIWNIIPTRFEIASFTTRSWSSMIHNQWREDIIHIIQHPLRENIQHSMGWTTNDVESIGLQERFRTITLSYIRGTSSIMAVFSASTAFSLCEN